jgi:hypothetical protein
MTFRSRLNDSFFTGIEVCLPETKESDEYFEYQYVKISGTEETGVKIRGQVFLNDVTDHHGAKKSLNVPSYN